MALNKKSYQKLYKEKNRKKFREYKREWQRKARHEYRRLHPLTPRQYKVGQTELKVLALYRENPGITVRQLSEMVKVTIDRIRQILHRNNLPLNKPAKKLPPKKKCEKCGKDYFRYKNKTKFCSVICLRIDPSGPLLSWPKAKRRLHLNKWHRDYYNRVLKNDPKFIRKRDERNYRYYKLKNG